MAVFRKSKKLGPLRLTATSKGLSVSGGVKGARVSANTKGEVRRTLSVPGAGIYDTKRISGGGKASQSTRTEAARTQVTYVEAVGGSRDLREGQDGVVTAKVVGLTDTIWNVASFAGVQPMEYGGIHGATIESATRRWSSRLFRTLTARPGRATPP